VTAVAVMAAATAIPMTITAERAMTSNAIAGIDPRPIAPARPRIDATVRLRLTRGCRERCLHCPDSALHGAPRRALSVDEVAAGLTAAFARFEPAHTQVIVSGGEPAEHPALLEVLALVRAWPIARLKLASNGIRLANDADFATHVLDAGIDQLLLSVDLATPRTLRSRDHALAVERLLGWLHQRVAQPRVALNTMAFEAPLSRLTAQIDALAALGADEVRVLRFDPSELPATPSLTAPSDATWRALRDWARQDHTTTRVTCVDRQHNLATRAERTIELSA